VWYTKPAARSGGGPRWSPPWTPSVLDEVFVVTRHVPEEEYFTGSGRQDTYRPAMSLAPELPDERSIQERFAP